MMDQKIRTQWVQALRSGDYLQGQHYLVQLISEGVRRHCCLGVLCELAVQAGVIPPSVQAGEELALTFGTGPYRSKATLPLPVLSWAGLESADPLVMTPAGSAHLTEMNDGSPLLQESTDPAHRRGYMYTFDEIADAIEASL